MTAPRLACGCRALKARGLPPLDVLKRGSVGQGIRPAGTATVLSHILTTLPGPVRAWWLQENGRVRAVPVLAVSIG